MKPDFTKIKIENIDGTFLQINVAKAFGNAVYQSTRDIASRDLAKRIYYSEGAIEITKEEAGLLLEELPRLDMPIALSEAITKSLKEG